MSELTGSKSSAHVPTFRRPDEMLTGLHERGRLDLLRAIRDHLLTPLEVWAEYRTNTLERLPRSDAIRSLAGAMRAWIEALVVPRMHRRTWEDKVREQTGRAIVAYDLRRTYAHWLEEARNRARAGACTWATVRAT